MSVPEFTGFTAETLAFLSGLKAENTRDCFDANRKTYEASVKKPARAFAEIMAGELESLTDLPHKAKLFRINRDIRFSKDKTPYNPHLHMSWLPADGDRSGAAFMFGLSPDYCVAGCGAFEFAKPVLDTYRQRIAGAAGEDLGRILDALEADGFRLQEPVLKRVPAGFPDDHPRVELSLHKGLAAWCDFEGPREATRPGIAALCLGQFERMMPLWRFIRGLA